MIYNPMTTLLKDSQAHGLSIANGLSMLVHQGVRALEIWSEAPLYAAAMMTAARDALNLPSHYD